MYFKVFEAGGRNYFNLNFYPGDFLCLFRLLYLSFCFLFFILKNGVSLSSLAHLKMAPRETCHLKDKLSKLSDVCAASSKASKFKKIDGKPATHGL